MSREKVVLLRRMTREDTEKIIRWRNSEAVRKQFLFRKPLTAAMHTEWIETKVEKGLVEQFIIVLPYENKEIGSVYFRDIDRKKGRAEFGIFIGEEKESGKGYGSKAMELALLYAKEQMKIKEVLLRVLKENQNAIRVYEKNGFCVIKDREEIVELDGEKRTVIFMERRF